MMIGMSRKEKGQASSLALKVFDCAATLAAPGGRG
jgi:hypothetical protein